MALFGLHGKVKNAMLREARCGTEQDVLVAYNISMRPKSP